MRVLFMGTTDYAEACLDAVIKAGHEVTAAVTQPDRPKNRGMKLAKSPVKEYAERAGIRVMQPTALRTPETAQAFGDAGADIFVVVAYGRILPQSLLDIPEKGCVNVHASLLPKYRGSAPIQWAVLNGEKETGVTVMYMDSEMDTGDMIASASIGVGEYESFGSVYERLKPLGAELLVKTLSDIENGTEKRTPQDASLATYAPPITKELCPIDWNSAPERIADRIRGLDPRPGATAVFGGAVYKLFSPRLSDRRTDAAPGSIVSRDRGGLEIACADGRCIIAAELQAPGGRRMSAADFLRGHTLE
jgi:methionyl-tRNA formyltransferase